jgi:hypothetical protein
MVRKAGQSNRGVVALATSRRLTAGALAVCLLSIGLGATGATGASAGLPKSYYGVVPQTPLGGGDFSRMAGGGVASIRIKVDWSNIQPTAGGGFNWAKTDADLQGATANGISPLLDLVGAPSWATGCKHGDCVHVAPVGSRKARRAWKHFCAAVEARYGPGGVLGAKSVRDYQIWNEENSSAQYKPHPSPSGYARLLKLAAKSIGGGDSKARIVLGGMFGTPGSPDAIYSWTFLKHLYKRNGIKKFFDAVALHPYSPNVAGIKAQAQLARRAMKHAGDGHTPVWITELGWASNHSSSQLSKGVKGQARMLKKGFRLLRHKRHAWNIERVFWYAWQDATRGTICDWCWAAGLVKHDGSDKPAWHAYRKLAR